MEPKRSTGEEDVVLTPSSSSSSCESEHTESEDHNDFVSLMDENGIIGLLEALAIVGVGEYSDDVESGHEVPSGLHAPVETETQLDEVGYDRSGSLLHRKSPAEGVQILTQSPVSNSKTERAGEKKSEGVTRRSDGKRNKSKHNNLSGMLRTTESIGVSKECSQICQHVSPATATCAQHHLRDACEEIPASLGIDAETFLDLSFTESFEEAHRCLSNLRLSPCFSPLAVFPEETMSGVDSTPVNGSKYSDQYLQPPTLSPRTMKQCYPDAARSSASFTTDAFKNSSIRPRRESGNPTASSKSAMQNKSSKSHLNGSTPDYSKVKPRVNFPKVIYKPPNSRLCSKNESLSFRPPTGCKSSVESVNKVGLNISGVPPATSDSTGECQELGSPQEATRLLRELEENYNKLWIRYAEAENTIDHLRLAAKVNLYSDGPKPGHLVQSINQEASKFVLLDFPQAQRAETSLISLLSDGHRTPQNTPRDLPHSPVTKEPVRILYSQASEFLQQLQTFEDLLNCRKLKSDERRKELSQLFEGLRSLESSFLLAKDEHKLLQKEEENSHFDPDRELEGLIFECVLYMDELKEHAEQITEDLLTPEPSPSPAHSPSLSKARKYPTHPQKTHVPSLVDPYEGAATMFSSISNNSDREDTQKETANSLHLKTVDDKLGHNGDFNKLPDNHENIIEIPRPLALSQKKEANFPTTSKTHVQPVKLEEEGPNRRMEKLKVKESAQQRNLSLEDPNPHPYSSAQPISQSTILDPSTQEGIEMRTSHSSLSSVGEITALEKRNSKLQFGSDRLLSQDGIVSPETDSGFIGTESRHPTPTEVPKLLPQGAMESFLVVQNRNSKNTHNCAVTSPDPYSLLPNCCPVTELTATSKFNSKQPRRNKPRKGQRRRTFTCSHLSWIKKSESEMSDIETSSSSVSKDGLTGHYTDSVTSVSPSSSCSSQHCHGSCTKGRCSTQLTNNSVSMQTLQAEVSRLHKRLESCLKEREQSVCSSATTVREKHHHSRTSTPRVRTVNTDVRAAVGKSPCCGLKLRHNPDVLGSSDQPQTQSVVSRCTQTLSAASHTNTVQIEHRNVSIQAPETSDEPDTMHFHSTHHQTPCLRCVSYQQTQAEVPAGSRKESIRSCRSHHCGSTDTDCHRFTHINTNTRHQPAEAVKCCAAAAAAPPSPFQYLCPFPVLLCPSPPYESPSNNNTAAGVRSHKKARKCSPSADRQNFLDCSLYKAIRAAKHMKTTSGHMSHSLRFGLHHQQQLLTPLMSQLSQRHLSS